MTALTKSRTIPQTPRAFIDAAEELAEEAADAGQFRRAGDVLENAIERRPKDAWPRYLASIYAMESVIRNLRAIRTGVFIPAIDNSASPAAQLVRRIFEAIASGKSPDDIAPAAASAGPAAASDKETSGFPPRGWLARNLRSL